MKMKNIFFLLLIFMFSLTYTQNIKKGFKNLEKKEYEKAKESFQKIISEDNGNVGANLGMALVLADDQSPVFDVIDSWQYASKVQNNTDKLNQEDIDIISEYFLNTEIRKTSRPVKKKIEIALEAIESRLIKYIREENNLEAVYKVLDKYPDFKYYNNVIHIRNQFEFRKYEKQNTLEGYQEFIAKFPNAAQVEKANNYIFKLAFDNVKTQNTVESYNNYIKIYPKSEFVQSAIKLRNAAAYNDTRKINLLQAYEQFIETYPDALEIAEAKIRVQDLLYEQAKKIKSLDAYNDFIKRYPEGRYFIDIFNLKAEELGTHFVNNNNLSANCAVEWSKGFDDNGKIESGGLMTVTKQGDYILACNSLTNDTSYSDVWILKLDASGKMIWNKTIGQPFEDNISDLMLDSLGNIIVAGYTYLSADSASKMGWLFKLGSDGKKIWNKNLGKIEIDACAIDKNSRIYIGGSTLNDSLGPNYMISIFNDDAKKIAERVFSGNGKITDLDINTDGNILVSGSNWLCLLDMKRYLIWDDTLKNSLESKKCTFTSDGYYFTGTGKESIFYSKYNLAGKKLWFQEYTKTDSLQIPVDIIPISPSGAVVAEKKSMGFKFKILAADGNIQKVMDFNGDFNICNITERGNNLMALIDNGDLFIISFLKSSSF
jgi:hypothetical protein